MLTDATSSINGRYPSALLLCQRLAHLQPLGSAVGAGDMSAAPSEFFARIGDLERPKKEQRLVRALACVRGELSSAM